MHCVCAVRSFLCKNRFQNIEAHAQNRMRGFVLLSQLFNAFAAICCVDLAGVVAHNMFVLKCASSSVSHSFSAAPYEMTKEMTFNYGAGTCRADLITSQRLTSTKFITHLAFNFSPSKVTLSLFKSRIQYSEIKSECFTI